MHRQSTATAEAKAAPRKKRKLLSTDISTTLYIEKQYGKCRIYNFLFTSCSFSAVF
ncbi:hypothetical protein CD006_08370 [Enterobacter sp. 10-1]|nr:hypothetical protein CD006_08370 [Enterobacter sp. 10-1]